MKKYLILASAAILALASCAKEQSIPTPVKEETILLNFVSERPQLASETTPSNAPTRTQWSTNKIVWSTGDKIRVGYKKDGSWMGQSEPGTAKFYKSGEVTIDGGNASVGTFSVPISGSAFSDPAVSGTYQFFAVCPGDAISGTDVADPTAKNITLPATQTPGSNTFDPTADILVGQTEGLSISGLPTDPIELNWTRLVAHADLTFSNLGFVGEEVVNKITLTFNAEAKVAGSFPVNIPAGTAGVGTDNEIILTGSNITSGADYAKAWACVLPVTFTSLTVELKTDKAIYTRVITGISKTFKQNAHNILTINMSAATRTAQVQKIADGNYVIVAYDGSSKYFAISSAGNKGTNRRDRSEITTVGFAPGNYSTSSRYTADNALIWTVTNVAGGVKVNLAGDTSSYFKYSGSNLLPLGTPGDTFDVNDGATSGTYTLVNTSKYIAMNGDSGFACYGSSTGVHDLFFVPATGTPTLVFPVTGKKVVADAESVSFTYHQYFLTDDVVLTITSDDGGAVASTDIEESVIKVNLNENTSFSDKDVTLTVSSTGASSVVLSIKQGRGSGDASTDDVLWAESFAGFKADDVPELDNYLTTVFACKSVTYSCTDSGTKIYEANTAGGESPEILIAKSGGVFTVSGIPTGGATGMTLTFKSNNGCTVSSGTSGVTVGSNLGSYTYGITLDSEKPTISLSFTNSSGSNTRVDDIQLVAGAPIPGITVATNAATSTATATGTTATLNGTLTLVNGAANSSVTSAGFYYKVNGSGDAYSKVTCASAPTSKTSFSYNLTGLTKGTTYTYYAWAIYDGGSEVTGVATEKTFAPTQSAQKTYTYTINTSDFTAAGYGKAMNTITATATDGSGATFDVDHATSNAGLQSSKIQFKKSVGMLYNTTDLGTVISVTLNGASGGTGTVYKGDSENPTSSGSGGYFTIKETAGSTLTCTSITVTFQN